MSFQLTSVALLLIFGHVSLKAQLLRPTEPLPSFEVATIKPWTPPVATGAPPPVKYLPVGAPAPVSDRVGLTGEIQFLIESAYGLSLGAEDRILGGPSWIRDSSARYQIVAKIAPEDYAELQKLSAAGQRERVSLMQQSLLADRFQFQAHFETRERPRYALSVAGNRSKLDPAQAGDVSRMSLASVGRHLELSATAVTIEELAQSPFLKMDQRQLVNRTGIEGRFSFTLRFTNGLSGTRNREDVSDAPDLPTALQEQLGLKLVPENGAVEVLVIDRIERPSEN